MSTAYPAIQPRFWTLRDEFKDQYKRELDFHIELGDYLFLLSQKIRLAEEELLSCYRDQAIPNTQLIELLHHLHRDLDYVQNNYQIERK